MKILLLFLLVLLAAPLRSQTPETLHVWGSPQMADLLHRYEAAFHPSHPEISFDEHLYSTLTAVPGVYTGRAQIGLLGRELWPTESQAFASVLGHPPTVITAATGSLDVPKATFALMVFVPAASPVRSLTVPQLEAIFTGRIRNWRGLGGRNRPIHLYGFTVENDKSQIFRDLVFRHGGRWDPSLKEFSTIGQKDAGQLIVEAIARDPDAIGISNIHYTIPQVRPLALAAGPGTPPIVATRQTLADSTYPLTRTVGLVIDQPTSPAVRLFLNFVLSAAGAQAVAEEGNYIPLTEPQQTAERRKLVSP